MTLPIRTTSADADSICQYLITKPTGATPQEARAVIDKKVLDGRKITAFKRWGLVDGENEKLMITERGRMIARDNGARRSEAFREIVSAIAPYRAAIERVAHRDESTLTALELAAHWFEHFKDEASENDKILNDQAVCFFQVAEAADFGNLVVGRKGQPTRFEFDLANAKVFATGVGTVKPTNQYPEESTADSPAEDSHAEAPGQKEHAIVVSNEAKNTQNNRVFITHGKNHKILEQVKEIVAYGKFEPVIAKERETAAKPVPDKVMDDMRACAAAVIHVGVEETLMNSNGEEVAQINGNVLIEIGAAMALYGRRFILLVEEGIKLPSNLQGLYECRYEGKELTGSATMKMLKAFNEFR